MMIAPKERGPMIKARNDRNDTFFGAIINMEYTLVIVPRVLAVNNLDLNYLNKQRRKK